MPTSRRIICATVASILALALASCGAGSDAAKTPDPSASSDGAFPLTLSSALGQVTIEKKPQRVATVSWVNDDVLLALGVVPVAAPTITWGGDQDGLTPWKRQALEGLNAAPGNTDAPTLYQENTGEVNYNELSKARPDLIIATYSGLDQEKYDKLSKIAPVVAYPTVAFGTPWQESTRIIGKAVGKAAEADELITRVEKHMREKVSQYPQLAGKTFIAGNIEAQAGGSVSIYTPIDNRSRILSELGLTLAPTVEQATRDAKTFYIDWSRERANELDSDIFFTWLRKDQSAETIASDPLLRHIPAVDKGGLLAESNETLSLSFSAASPLSLPWMLEKFLPRLAEAASSVDKGTGKP